MIGLPKNYDGARVYYHVKAYDPREAVLNARLSPTGEVEPFHPPVWWVVGENSRGSVTVLEPFDSEREACERCREIEKETSGKYKFDLYGGGLNAIHGGLSDVWELKQ